MYDACGDPVAVSAILTAILTGGHEAALTMEQDGEIVTFEPTCRVSGSGSAADAARVESVTVVDAGDPTVVVAGDLELVLARVVGTGVNSAQTLTAQWGDSLLPVVVAGCVASRSPRVRRSVSRRGTPERSVELRQLGRARDATRRQLGGARLDVVRAGRSLAVHAVALGDLGEVGDGRGQRQGVRHRGLGVGREHRGAGGGGRVRAGRLPEHLGGADRRARGDAGAVHTSYSALAWCPAPSSPASAERSAKESSSMARFS